MLSDCYILDNNFEKAFEVLKKLSDINPTSDGVFNIVRFLPPKRKHRGVSQRIKTRFSCPKN